MANAQRSRRPDGMDDSQASKRADALQRKLKFDIYARFPVDHVDFMMDLPPTDAQLRARWKPIIRAEERVFHTYLRFSWCWPFCWEYALVAEKREEILWDAKDQPQVLTEEMVADMLGMSRARVQVLVLDLQQVGRVRIQKAGRQHKLAVFPEGKPYLDEDQRRCCSTLAATGLEGPRFELAVQRRIANAIKLLGEDDALEVDIGTLNGGESQVIRVGEYRTQLWQRAIARRTEVLSAFKQLRMEERRVYGEICQEARAVAEKLPVKNGGAARNGQPKLVSQPVVKPVDPAEELESFAAAIRQKFEGKGSAALASQCDRWFAQLRTTGRSVDVFFAWLTPEKLRRIESVGAVGKLITEFDDVCRAEDSKRAQGEALAANKARAFAQQLCRDAADATQRNELRRDARQALAASSADNKEWGREILDILGEEDEG